MFLGRSRRIGCSCSNFSGLDVSVMKKGTFFILSIVSFLLFLLQWSPWADWPREAGLEGAKPVFSYLGLNGHWFGLEQHFWTTAFASFAVTFLAAAVFLGEDDDEDEDDEDF